MANGQEQHKILFIGPVGAGKTTAVAAASDKAVVCTDVAVSDMTRVRKPRTTIALDYGVTTLADGKRVHLYGAPGQERFDFMWEILREGISGLAILIDNSRRSPLDDLGFYLRWRHSFSFSGKMAIGVSFTDRSPLPGLGEYRDFLRAQQQDAPVCAVDARRREDVHRLLHALFAA